MKTIAYGDDSLKKLTQTLRVFMHALFRRHQLPPAVRVAVDLI